LPVVFPRKTTMGKRVRLPMPFNQQQDPRPRVAVGLSRARTGAEKPKESARDYRRGRLLFSVKLAADNFASNPLNPLATRGTEVRRTDVRLRVRVMRDTPFNKTRRRLSGRKVGGESRRVFATVR
jgi:hypothetical protein